MEGEIVIYWEVRNMQLLASQLTQDKNIWMCISQGKRCVLETSEAWRRTRFFEETCRGN